MNTNQIELNSFFIQLQPSAIKRVIKELSILDLISLIQHSQEFANQLERNRLSWIYKPVLINKIIAEGSKVNGDSPFYKKLLTLRSPLCLSSEAKKPTLDRPALWNKRVKALHSTSDSHKDVYTEAEKTELAEVYKYAGDPIDSAMEKAGAIESPVIKRIAYLMIAYRHLGRGNLDAVRRCLDEATLVHIDFDRDIKPRKICNGVDDDSHLFLEMRAYLAIAKLQIKLKEFDLASDSIEKAKEKITYNNYEYELVSKLEVKLEQPGCYNRAIDTMKKIPSAGYEIRLSLLSKIGRECARRENLVKVLSVYHSIFSLIDGSPPSHLSVSKIESLKFETYYKLGVELLSSVSVPTSE